MVTCLRDDLIQIQFPSPSTDRRYQDQEIVCYVRLIPTGLEINYSHHILHSRNSATGPHNQHDVFRYPLTLALRAMIEQCVMFEFWSAFSRTVQVVPFDLNTPLSEMVF